MKPLTLDLATPVHRLVLIGGGEFSFGETRAIDEFLIARMPKDRRTIAFLPTASGSVEYATHIGAYFKTLDPSVDTVNVPIYRGRDNRRQKSLNAILAAGLVYLGGGVLNNLIATLSESPAEIALRDTATNGAVIAGIGAAASAFGARGFGWLRETIIEAPFDPANDEPLRRLMSLPEVRIGVGIPARTALVVHGDGTTEILGDGRVAVFRKPSGL